MATGIFATIAEVQKYVPEWADATYNVEAYIDQYTSFWESYINCITELNFSDDYAGLNVDVKRILSLMLCANVAMDICAMNHSGTDIRVAEFFFDRMTDISNKCENKLKENAKDHFVKDA